MEATQIIWGVSYLCVARQSKSKNSTAGNLCYQRKKCLQDLQGPRSIWTTTNCKTKLRKMSSITSMFTFSQFIFLKGPILRVVTQRQGERRGLLPPGNSEKLPLSCWHSPNFWHALTHKPLCAPDFLSFKLKTQPSMILRCYVSGFLWLSIVIYSFGVTCFPWICPIFCLYFS